MIGSIRGKITLKTDKFVVVEAGSVGYKISIPTTSLLNSEGLGGEIFLWIHTHIREDVLDLYGFKDRQELEFFEMLLSVSGIGPKGALSVLSIAGLETLKRAVSSGDTSYLTKISGIGKKTAEKIVLELRDKIKNELATDDTSRQSELDSMEALKALGYGQGEIREALKKVTPGIETNKKIKEALKILGGHSKDR